MSLLLTSSGFGQESSTYGSNYGFSADLSESGEDLGCQGYFGTDGCGNSYCATEIWANSGSLSLWGGALGCSEGPGSGGWPNGLFLGETFASDSGPGSGGWPNGLFFGETFASDSGPGSGGWPNGY